VRKLKLSRIDPCSIVNGDGCRLIVVFSGCSLNCQGCFSKELQDFNVGVDISPDNLSQIIADHISDTTLLDGITLSGGNPQEQSDLLPFLKKVRGLMPKKFTIWMWSGFTMEEILKDSIKSKHLDYIDVIITGRYVESRKVEHTYFGSDNQEVWRKTNDNWNKDDSGEEE